MPMIWDAAAEAKLLAEIFNICAVKVTEAQKQQLAAIMGPGCTPKAITHRIAKIKSGGATAGGAEARKMTVGVKTSAPVTKAGGGGGRKTAVGAGTKRALRPEEADDGEDEGPMATPAPRPRGRDGKKGKIKEEPSEDGIEMGEDVGEGLRKGPRGGESEDEF